MKWADIRWSLYAPIYDVLEGPLRAGRRRSIELADLHTGESVLLVGAGTGLDLPHLPTGLDLTAVDVSPAMVARLKRRARTLGLNVDARVMDAHRLDFADASFDAVLLHLILAVIPHPEVCAREAARVLRPGGRVAVFDKWLWPGERPSLVRRMTDPIAWAFATHINRRLEPLMEGAGLRITHDEPALFNGLVRASLAVKP
jgi:ubiquinone/menaquinone biosynthesis C-methylase UbiE